MARYSAQFRNFILKKMMPPESRSASDLAKEYGITVSMIYNWKARMNNGTLQVDDGVQSNRGRKLMEKFSLLLESRGISEDKQGTWLRENGLHSEHLTVWEQEVRDFMTKGEQQAREELKAIKKELKKNQKELDRKD
ncbi:transposase [Oceanispirochaeta crateris]|nr:transposase [Oceanispirochaeta crateris]